MLQYYTFQLTAENMQYHQGTNAYMSDEFLAQPTSVICQELL